MINEIRSVGMSCHFSVGVDKTIGVTFLDSPKNNQGYVVLSIENTYERNFDNK